MCKLQKNYTDSVILHGAVAIGTMLIDGKLKFIYGTVEKITHGEVHVTWYTKGFNSVEEALKDAASEIDLNKDA